MAIDIEKAIASFEDDAVRLAVSRAFGESQQRGSSQAKVFRTALRVVLGYLPPSTRAHEVLGIVRAFLEGRPPGGGNSASAERHMATLIFVKMALGENPPESPEAEWIRENAALLSGRSRAVPVIAEVLSSGLPVSRFRMLRVKKVAANPSVVLLAFDTDSSFVQDTAVAAFTGASDVPSVRRLCRSFAESLGGFAPQSAADLTERTLSAQMRFFSGKGDIRGEVAMFYLTAMRRAESGSGLSVSDGITHEYLERSDFVSRYEEGYRAVLANPIDPVPRFDRWVVFPNGTEDSYAEGKPNRGESVDFTGIDPHLRETAKRMFWEGDASIPTKCAQIRAVSGFLEWRKSGHRVVTPGGDYLVSADEVEFYLLRQGSRPDIGKSCFTVSRGSLSAFLSMLEEERPGAVDPLCDSVIAGFGGRRDSQADGGAAMPDEHYEALLSALKARSQSEGSSDAALDYAAFLVTAQTPLRNTSVFDVRMSAISETSRRGIFSVRQPQKTTGRDSRGIQLHPSVKEVIDLAVAATADIREQAPEELRDYVFLKRGPRGSFVVMPRDSWVTRLKSLCRKIGIPEYSSSSIRKRCLTRASNSAMARGKPPEATRPLTDHETPRTDEAYYIRREDREYYEAVYEIEIGAAKIRGVLSADPPEEAGPADLVAGGAGWCQSDDCLTEGAVSCLLCKWFRTCPSQIPAFEAAVARIDERIAMSETTHDRRHLSALKSLYVAYICALASIEEART